MRSFLWFVLLCLVATVTSSNAQETLFFDDFEDGMDPAWVQPNGGWIVENGQLKNTTTCGFQSCMPDIWAGGPGFVDYVVSFDLRLSGGNIYIYVMANDPAEHEQGQSGAVSIDTGNSGTPCVGNVFRLFPWPDTDLLASQSGPEFCFDPNTTYRLKFGRIGQQVKYKKWPVSDPEPTDWLVEVYDDTRHEGYWGISFWNGYGVVDNFKVETFQTTPGVLSFTDISTELGAPVVQMGAGVWGDFDMDSAPDFLGTTEDRQQLVLLEIDGGQFHWTELQTDVVPNFSMIRTLDYDRDGDLDILGINLDSQELMLFANEVGSFAGQVLPVLPSSVIGRRFQVVDFEANGWPDIVYHAFNGSSIDLVLLRNVSGNFQAETLLDYGPDQYWGDFYLFDFNLDGYPDVLQGSMVADGCLSPGYRVFPHYLHINQDGVALEIHGSSPVVEMPAKGQMQAFDIDNDGWLDVFNGTPDFICNGGEEKNWLLRNNAGASLYDGSVPSMNYGSNYFGSFHPVDVDHDGDLDYFHQVETWTHSRLFINNGDVTFTEVSDQVGLTYGAGRDGSSSNYWFDLDGDGDQDLLRATRTRYPEGEGRIIAYRNDGVSGNWLAVNPIPAQSVTSQVGLRVAAHVGGTVMTRLIDDIGAPMVHFGLGSYSSVDSVVVHWPSGMKTTVEEVAANQEIDLLEYQYQALPIAADFDSGSADQFTPETGDWEVVDGTYHCYNDSPGEKHVSTIGELDWTDYRVELDIKTDGALIQEFLVRYQSPGDWYVVTVLPEPNNRMTLWKCVGGSETQLLRIDGYPNTPNVWHHMAVEVQGPAIRLTFDGDELFTYYDEDEPFLTGKVGLVSFANNSVGWQDAYFDNVAITEPAGSFLMEAQVNDTPEDQGGFVDLTWTGSIYDAPGLPDSVTTYSVQKLDGEAWTEVASIVADQSPSYTATVPCDHVLVEGETPAESTFRVVSLSPYPETAGYSVEAAGYSVDNIAPPAPEALLVEDLDYRYVVWTVPELPDLGQMCVYRGTEAGFVPDVPIACPDIGFYEETHLGYYFYRVQFKDIHGNASEFSEELHGMYPTGVQDVLPRSFTLAQNYPNPFNPSTTIKFSLPEQTPVSLDIYDVAGKRVRQLIGNQVMSAGHQDMVWDGRDDQGRSVSAGVYFYKLKAGEFVETRRMALVK